MAEIVGRLEIARSEGILSVPIELGGGCSIGRGKQNTIVLEDESVSRRHAIIDCQSCSECYVTDVGSRNGTFLNRVRVGARTRLRHGDCVAIGALPITFWFTTVSQADDRSLFSDCTELRTAEQYVTVVVADIRDFTGLTKRLGEQRVSEVVGEYIRLSGDELDRAGAATQKYIGDAVMGVWDHGLDPPPAGAVIPALLSVAKLFEIAAASQARFGLDAPLQIGAAINTGPAIVGNLGSRAAPNYTALGDTINKAFRLESASKEVHHDLVIGSSTWECLSPDLQRRFQACMVALKGYEQPESAYGTSRSSLLALYKSVSNSG